MKLPDNEEVSQLPKYWLPDKLYDVLKWAALIVCPLVAVAYPWLAQIWGLPLAEEVGATATWAGLVIGVLIGASQLKGTAAGSAAKRAGGALAVAAVAVAVAMGAPTGAYAYESREAIVSQGHGSMTPQWLVIHETANPGASAANHVSYWRRSQPNVSMTHYVMELDGSVVYHTQGDYRVAYHVGNGNWYGTVGIELAHATNASDFNKQWAEAVKWAGDYLKGRGWGVDRMLSHSECRAKWGGTDHTDPISYFNSFGKSWTQFKQAVAAYMGSGTAPGGNAGSGGGQSHGSAPDVEVTYMAMVDGEWLPEVTDWGAGSEGFAGIPYEPMEYVAIKVDRGTVRYRAHTVGGGWLPWVTGFSYTDTVYGAAGDGTAIDGIQVYYQTASGEPWQQAYYRSQTTERAGYLPVCCDDGTTYYGYDGWAGLYGEPMDRLQIDIEPACRF